MRNILIIDDQEVVREGVMKILEELGANTFGEAGTALQALNLAREQAWDIAVLNLSIGGGSGLAVLKDLKQIHPTLPVLVLSMHPEEQYARRAYKAGAAGCVSKASPRSELIQAIQKIIEGGRYISPALAENLLLDMERGIDRPLHETLSDREYEVMRLIASGKTVREIAELLSLSAKTVSTYRTRILEKMRMKTNAELTHYAIHAELVD